VLDKNPATLFYEAVGGVRFDQREMEIAGVKVMEYAYGYTDLASRIVWFDSFVTNVDRTARNTNMLMWHRRLWLIDHGATLYAHHAPEWQTGGARPRDPFAMIKSHVLRRRATELQNVDAAMAEILTEDLIGTIVEWIPDAWLTAGGTAPEVGAQRAAYTRYLTERLTAPRAFAQEAARAD
jgi:hypothetical protein